MKKRVYDIAACNTHLRVFWNGDPVNIHHFRDYVGLYTDSNSEVKEGDDTIAYETVYDANNVKRWEVAVLHSPTGEFNAISFVNSVYTPGGGTHVSYILDKVVKTVQGLIEKSYPTVSNSASTNLK